MAGQTILPERRPAYPVDRAERKWRSTIGCSQRESDQTTQKRNAGLSPPAPKHLRLVGDLGKPALPSTPFVSLDADCGSHSVSMLLWGVCSARGDVVSAGWIGDR